MKFWTTRNTCLVGSLCGIAFLATVAMARWADLRAAYCLSTRFEELRTNAQGLREFQHEQTGILFVQVPATRATIGSPSEELGRADDEIQRTVTVPRFLIAKYELSQGEWKAVMGGNPSAFSRDGDVGAQVGPDVNPDDLPVENVSWDDCVAFCRATGLSLPDEYQWEIACRAGTSTPFSLGDSVSTYEVNHDGRRPYAVAARGFYRGRTVPVRYGKPNDFGLHHMHGNVQEWCRGKDLLEDTPVIRGGGWSSPAARCRSSAREPPRRPKGGDTGFRPVYNLYSR